MCLNGGKKELSTNDFFAQKIIRPSRPYPSGRIRLTWPYPAGRIRPTWPYYFLSKKSHFFEPKLFHAFPSGAPSVPPPSVVVHDNICKIAPWISLDYLGVIVLGHQRVDMHCIV